MSRGFLLKCSLKNERREKERKRETEKSHVEAMMGPNFCLKEVALDAVLGTDWGQEQIEKAAGTVQVRDAGGWGSQWWGLGREQMAKTKVSSGG